MSDHPPAGRVSLEDLTAQVQAKFPGADQPGNDRWPVKLPPPPSSAWGMDVDAIDFTAHDQRSQPAQLFLFIDAITSTRFRAFMAGATIAGTVAGILWKLYG